MIAAISTEATKLRRSRVVLVATLAQVVLLPLLALVLVRAASSGGVGVLAGKSEALVAGTGWDAYLGILGQVAAAALFVGGGVVVAWVFGREHVDGTFGGLFALTVPRGHVATAKVLVVAAWTVAVTAGVLCATVAVGVLGSVGEVQTLPSLDALGRLAVVVELTLLLTLPVALVASLGRGYLPAIGAVIGVVAVAQVSVFLGMGAWFPFTVPGLLAVGEGAGVPTPGVPQVALAMATAAAGALGTVQWWRRAEVV